MSKYQNGKVYKVVNDIDDQIYVGSTQQSLAKRWGDHISAAKTGCKIKLYDLMEKYGSEHFKIILLANIECNSIAQEQIQIDQLKPTLNVRRAFITPEVKVRLDSERCGKYRLNHPERVAAKSKSQYEQHKEALSKEQECICGGSYTYRHKARHELTQRHVKHVGAVATEAKEVSVQ